MSKTDRSNDRAMAILFSVVRSPLMDRIRSAYAQGRHHEIAALSIADCSFDYKLDDMSAAAARFREDYRAVSLLSKATFLDLKIDRRAAAIEKWIDAEESCRVINQVGRMFSCVPERGPFELLISRARVLIRKTLPEFSWDDVHDKARYSGGASTSRKRSDGHPVRKYQDKPDVTPDCFPLAIAAIRADQQWFYSSVLRFGPNPVDWVRVVEGSKMDTVPKNSKSDRVICIEPDINMMFQRGIGAQIRCALKRVGVNLNSQEWNQQLAAIGSRTGSLSTIDLASASDSISLSLVKDLLPYEWFDAMFLTRSHVTLLGDKLIPLEKISSMGNGYTFELESLIFWALTRAVVDHLRTEDRRIAIYGDDIICHHSAAPLLIELLAYCGFTTNVSKSFVSGPFRESCGKHYFLGRDVTPFYVKEPIRSKFELFRVANCLSEWDEYDAARRIQLMIPFKDRLRVPRRFGLKAGLWDPVVPHARPRMRNYVWEIHYFGEKIPTYASRTWADLHYALGYSDGMSPNPDARKGGRMVRKRTFSSTWD